MRYPRSITSTSGYIMVSTFLPVIKKVREKVVRSEQIRLGLHHPASLSVEQPPPFQMINFFLWWQCCAYVEIRFTKIIFLFSDLPLWQKPLCVWQIKLLPKVTFTANPAKCWINEETLNVEFVELPYTLNGEVRVYNSFRLHHILRTYTEQVNLKNN